LRYLCKKTIAKITQLEDKIALFIANGTKSQTETLEQLQPDETEQDENPDDIDQWLVGKKLKFDLAHLNLNEWLNDLKTDKKALQKLADIAKLVQPQRDAKLQTLKNIISQKVQKPANPNNKKIIVFTAFADTAKYLYDNLKHWANNTLQLHIAMVAGGNTYTSLGKNDFGNILSNFAPIAKKRNQNTQITEQKQIDILIATDCISEGQNLQDADYLVNYDIHWNPVRIIQRFGRIDRLGSKNTTIQLVNFWPTKDLDNYLNLKTRVEARMALVDLTASNEDNLLEDKTNKDPNNAIKDMIEDDLKYRYKQLKKLQEEVLDIEDLEDNLDLTDFSLQDFRAELQQFFDQNKQKLKDAPLGLYAIVPAPNNPQIAKQTRTFTDMEQNIIQPGVIFCLRQKGENKENQRVNLLHPYLLVYIYNNGEVKYNYDNAKQILEVFRLLCQNQKPVYETLCDLFNQQTQHGKNMEQYTNLLKKAAKDVYQHFNKRNAQQVLANSSGLFAIQNKPLSQLENFELITWLIIN
jgi:superfamily II DNA/RNA helicase